MRACFLVCALFILSLVPARLVQAQTLQISALNDLSLGSWSGSGDLFNEDSVCIYNLGVTDYKITASGSGAGGSFALTSSGGSLAYEVQFKGSTGSYEALVAGSPHSFNNANTTSQNCGGLTNADIKVTAKAAALGNAISGNYSGTLTILLETN